MLSMNRIPERQPLASFLMSNVRGRHVSPQTWATIDSSSSRALLVHGFLTTYRGTYDGLISQRSTVLAFDRVFEV